MTELFELQQRLVATKTNWNEFSNFSYRSLEDILQKAKPLLSELKCVITLTDEMVMLGDRFYIKSIATLQNENGEKESAIGWAREPEEIKGMSAPQVTGTASSYARKYALASLLAIDDNKDIDSMDNGSKQSKISHSEPSKDNITLLTEFCSAKKLEIGVDINQLTKFYNHYSTKDFKGKMNVEQLWNIWIKPKN